MEGDLEQPLNVLLMMTVVSNILMSLMEVMDILKHHLSKLVIQTQVDLVTYAVAKESRASLRSPLLCLFYKDKTWSPTCLLVRIRVEQWFSNH